MLTNDIKSNEHNKDPPHAQKKLSHIKKLEFLKKGFLSHKTANYLSNHTNTFSKNCFPMPSDQCELLSTFL